MNILVTGAAGYIGSVVADKLIKEGHRVIAIDNLKTGHLKAVHPEAVFIRMDLGDAEKLPEVFSQYSPEAVMHFAASSLVSESMSHPEEYFFNNVVSGANLLKAMLKSHVKNIVFSSSAAVYGEPDEMPLTEETPEKPVSFYGESKLMFERLLSWWAKVYGLTYVSLRYFNAAGAAEKLGEDHAPETHLIPNLLKVALGQLSYISVFGNEYDTPDGTCIRDYVHVLDIAQANVLALNALTRGENKSSIYNLGNERGYSVLDVVRATEAIVGKPLPVKVEEKRKADPPVLIASSAKIRQELGWQPDYPDIKDIIASAWEWQRQHPHGYQE